MAEVTNEPIYGVREAMQARLGNVDEGLREVRGEWQGVRGNRRAQQLRLNAVQTDIGTLHEATGAIDSRLARIERRLDIIDVPAT